MDHFSRPDRLDREARLCFLGLAGPFSTERPTGPREIATRGERTINNIFKNVVGNKISPEEVTAKKLASPLNMLAAFRQPGILTDPDVVAQPDPEHPTWPHLLRSWNLDERKAAFVRFVHQILPLQTRINHKDLFEKAIIAPPNIVTANFEALQGIGGSVKINEPSRELTVLLDTLSIILGADGPDVLDQDPTKIGNKDLQGNIAREALNQIYSPNTPNLLFADFARLRSLLLGKLEEPQVRSPGTLLKYAPEGFLRGWLLTNWIPDEEVDRLRTQVKEGKAGAQERLTEVETIRGSTQETINRMMDFCKAKEIELKAVADKARVALNQIDPVNEKNAINEGKTVRQIQRRLNNKYPSWPIIAAGLGLYSWMNKDFIPAWIRKTVKYTALGGFGTWVWMTYVNGNPNAFDDITGAVQTVGKYARSGIDDQLKKWGTIAPEPRSFYALNRMVEFFGEANPQDVYASSIAFSMMAEMNFGTMAMGYQMPSALYPHGNFIGMQNPAFRQELTNICTKRGYNQPQIEAFFYQHQRQIADAMATFLFQFAASSIPGEIRLAQRIERAREAEGPSASYFDIKPTVMDPENPGVSLRDEFLHLLLEGHLSAQRNKMTTLVMEIAHGLMTSAELGSRPVIDTAHIVDKPEKHNYALKEFEFLGEKNKALRDIAPERKALVEAAKASFLEFLKYAGTRDPKLISGYNETNPGGAHKKLKNICDSFCASDAPVADIQLALEDVRYRVLVAANLKDTITLDENDIEKQVVAASETPSSFLGKSWEFIQGLLRDGNALLPLSGGFNEVKNIGHVKALLSTSLITFNKQVRGIEDQTFDRMLAQLDGFKKRIEHMKKPAEIAERIVMRLAQEDPEFRNRFTGTTAREAVIRILTSLPTKYGTAYVEQIEKAERNLSPQIASTIARAMLVIEQKDGEDKVVKYKKERVFSPVEEANAIARCNKLFDEGIGNGEDIASGTWGRILLADAMKALEKENANLIPADISRKENGQIAVESAAEIGRAYLLLHNANTTDITQRKATEAKNGALKFGEAGYEETKSMKLEREYREKIEKIALKLEYRWFEDAFEIADKKNKAKGGGGPVDRDDLKAAQMDIIKEVGAFDFDPKSVQVLIDVMNLMNVGQDIRKNDKLPVQRKIGAFFITPDKLVNSMKLIVEFERK